MRKSTPVSGLRGGVGFVLLGVLGLFGAGAAGAAPITILNPSFEQAVLALPDTFA